MILSVRVTQRLLKSSSLRQLPPDPRHEEVYNPMLPLDGNRGPARHLPPLGEAVAAAAGTGVLCLENGMPAHRRLLPVVLRIRRCKPRSDELLAMGSYRLHPLLCYVLPVRRREVEPVAELRLRKPRESRIIAVYQISTYVGS